MMDVGWIALSLTGRIGNKTLQALLKHFENDTTAILRADVKALQQVPGVGPKIAQSIRGVNLKTVEQALTKWRQMGVQVLAMQGSDYPSQLRSRDDAAPTLFFGGRIIRTEKSIAIVGTGNPSD